MAEPVTTAKAVMLATNVAKKILKDDDDSTKATIFAVVAGGVLIFGFTILLAFYLLTLPFSWLGGLFMGEEYTMVTALREEAKYAALEEPYYDYVEGFVTFGGGQLALPCEGFTITSPYGYRNNPFVTGGIEFHRGIDLQPSHHSPVVSVYEGVVTQASSGYNGGHGGCVEVEHEIDGVYIYSFYSHLSRIDVDVGDEVEQGDVLGIEGGDPDTDPNAGRSTGHHVHFEIRKASGYGNDVDPYLYLFGE